MDDRPGTAASPEALVEGPIDAVPVALAVLDEDGVVVRTNDARPADDGTGTEGALPDVGSNYVGYLEAADGTAGDVADGIRSVVEGEVDGFTHEYPQGPPTDRRWHLMHAAPFEEGGERRTVIVRVDVTDRKAVEADLRLKERAMDEAPVGITISDPDLPDNPLVYANGAFERITGYPIDEVVGRNCRFLQGPGTDEEAVSRIREAIEAAETVTVEVRNYRRNGESFWNEVTIAPVVEEGEVVNYVGFQKDVTERKQAEAELESQHETLAVLNQVVRHDIRNDMSVILGWAQNLEDHVDGEAEEVVDRIVEASEHVVELTETVGTLANAVIDEDEPDLEAVDLADALRGELDKTEITYQRRSEEVELDAPDDLPAVEVLADGMLSSVFSNLLNNAVLHNDKAVPRIGVSVEVDESTATVSVADNGPGIPDDRKDEVFGRGEKGLESPGSGLGLYLVDTLVDRYGGDVTVEDNEPEGAVFRVGLPRAG